ncbi:MAG TPA: hypothetical protein VF444_00785 [Pseudonocardiaceae bacterium]
MSQDANIQLDTSQNFTELQTVVTNLAQLDAAVQSGQVVLDPETGTKLLASLRTHSDSIDQWRGTVSGLTRALPLGNNPVGDAMAAKFMGRADGDTTGLASVLDLYKQGISYTIDAVTQAMQRYQANEETIQGSVNGIATS